MLRLDTRVAISCVDDDEVRLRLYTWRVVRAAGMLPGA